MTTSPDHPRPTNAPTNAPTTGVMTEPAARSTARTARRLGVAVVVLVLVDLVGGLIAVWTGLNEWSEAWGPTALLAAPLPMIAGQVLLTYLCLRTRRRWGAVPAILLAAACFASILSGFFDGGIGNDALTPWHTAYQWLLLGVTGAVGLLAVLRARDLLSRDRMLDA